jgi:dUTP pyrophosphatase
MIEAFKFETDAVIPSRANRNDAGLDIYSYEDVVIPVGATVKIRTGIGLHVPEGYVGKIEDRGSLASKGLKTCAGVVDAGYSGELLIVMHNLSAISGLYSNKNNDMETVYEIKKGDKIAQFLLYIVNTAPAVEVKQLWTSDRNSKGFGSSGN